MAVNGRVVFSKGFDANMMAIDGTWRRGCILKDVCQSGARLIMLDTIEGRTHPASTPGRARWSAAKRLGSDGGLGLLVRLPIPGKKISDLVGRVIWKAGEHVGEPCLGIDVVYLAGLDQGIDSGGTISASI